MTSVPGGYSAYIEGENLATSSDPQYLLELLELILRQFKIVAHVHRVVLANLTRVKVSAVGVRVSVVGSV